MRYVNRVAVEKRFRKLFFRRRFHAYCIGAAKTGTTTVAAMLRRNFLAAHEPETFSTNRLVINFMSGQLQAADVRKSLHGRDRRLRLEMEPSHPLGYVAPILQELHPKARFVVTVREPMSWLRSRVNFHHSTNPPMWREYRQFFWYRHNRGYASEETVLGERGLVSLDTYLEQYAAHYRLLNDPFDWDRAVVLKTSDLSICSAVLAGFRGITPEEIDVRHIKIGQSAENVLGQIDPEFVQSKMSEHCQFLMEKWFPDAIARQN